jgi:hypothetical protein
MNQINERQLLTILVWLVFVIICVLFPPYTYTKYNFVTKVPYLTNEGILSEREVTAYPIATIVRYGFLFSDPPRHNKDESYDGFSQWRLILEIIVVTLLSSGAFLFFRYYRSPKNKYDDPNTNKPA